MLRFCPALLAVVLALPSVAQDAVPVSGEFDDPASLENWHRFYEAEGWPDMMQHLDADQTAPGALFLQPYASGWFDEFHAPYLFQLVTGDFDVVTRIRATGTTGPTPLSAYSLTGVMVRAPRTVTSETWTPEGENWLFITTGAGDPPGTPMIETKNTLNSRSELLLHAADTGWVELRIRRRGALFHLDYRYDNDPWTTPDGPFNRPDLPNTVQVGLTAYSDWPAVEPYQDTPHTFNTKVTTDGNPDLYAYVDYVRFSDPAPTSVERPGPEVHALSVYPHPFQTEATFTFTLSAPGPVVLTVYDVLGRRVDAPLDAFVPAGTQSVTWTPDALPPGLYFYRLETGGRPRSGTLVYLR